MPADGVKFLDVAAAHAELREPLEAAWRRVLEGGSFILGSEVTAFEAEFARYCGARHCVGIGNGLDALQLVLRAWGVGQGDEVIVPSNTYIATWLAVTLTGATVVPVEPDERTLLLDADRIDAAVTPRTKVVLPVHLYGAVADMTAIREVAAARRLRVLEDAAQAHGARWEGRRVGSLCDASAWSFYPSKNLGALGDAGAVTTDDDALADRLRLLRNYGSRVKYEHETFGINSRLDELQAALLRAKLPVLDAWNDRRRRIAREYLKRLAGVPGLTLPAHDPRCEPVWHVFVVRHPRRAALQRALAERGIGTLIHYPVPPSLSGTYRAQFSPDAFPIARRSAEQVLSIPIGPHTSDDDVERVITALETSARALAG
jgi:dTDP-4-amino-4,6-dideoxygalactose transaminase